MMARLRLSTVTNIRIRKSFKTTANGNISINGKPFNNGDSVEFTKKLSTKSNVDQQGQQNSSSKKGKLYKLKKFHKSWSWKAGAGWTILSVLDWWLLAAGGWLTWRGVFLKWTPLGLCLVAAAQWTMINDGPNGKGQPRRATSWQVIFLRNINGVVSFITINFLRRIFIAPYR